MINRYKGDEEEVKDEKDHLSELLLRIEERKRQRAAESKHAEGTKQIEDEPAHKKKKKEEHETDKQSIIEKDVSVCDDANDNEDKAISLIKSDEKSELKKGEQQKSRKKRRKKEKRKQSLSETISDDNKNLVNIRGTEIENQEDLALDDTKTVEKTLSEQENTFMVLGSHAKKKKREVRRVLPDWLVHPKIFSTDLGSGPSLKKGYSMLNSQLVETLKANGIKKLFPVQHSMICWILKCYEDRKRGWWLRDTCVSAPTGSGKTLAYVLPIVHVLKDRLIPKIRCLVVVPVQELAAQVYKVMTTYTNHTSLRVAILSGAASFEQEQSYIVKKNNRDEYISTVDIVVATPGRLVDHILKTEGFCLSDLHFVVIDEADRDADWLQYLPQPHYRAPRITLQNLRGSKIPAQKLLFSATLSQDPEKLERLGLLAPILFTSVIVSGKDDDVNLDKEVGDFVGRYTSPEELKEVAVECPPQYKPIALYELVNRNDDVAKTLVFTNSGQMAHRLALLLGLFFSEKNVAVGELSAQLLPKQREKVLQKFATGEIHVLVSSDALARGVDIPDVQLVVSYDLPKHIKGYIHRAGRTGRAGKVGTAVSILTTSQLGIFKHMLNNAHKAVPNIEKLDLESLAETMNYETHVEKLKEILEKEKEDNLQRIKAEKRV